VVAPVAAGQPEAPAPPVAGQVAPAVATLASGPDGTHTMTLVLTPETLGQVEVRVTVTAGTLDLSLRGASEHGRAALLDALPDLRRDLEAAGLTCSRLQVDRDPAGSAQSQAQQAWQQAQQQAGGQSRGHGQADDRARPWLRGTDPDGSRPAPVATHPASTALDVRV
jgi:flagellar hook-length control protein FliK